MKGGKGKNRTYDTGEILYLWGKPYRLIFAPDKVRSLSFHADETVLLTMKREANAAERERFVDAQYRLRLHREIARRMPFWEEKMGLYSSGFKIRDMKSRWGSCNIVTKVQTFNLQLVQWEVVCLDYVIIHELAHLKERNHNPAFWSIVSGYMPDWKRVKQLMNSESPAGIPERNGTET